MASQTVSYTVDSIPLEQVSSSQRATESSRQEESPTVKDDDQPPSHAVDVVQKWNSSRANIFKTFTTFYHFIVLGANDAVFGAIIPYLETYYDISYIVVSLVFLSPFIGYIFAALLNNRVHKRFGQRGVTVIGPIAHLIAYIIIVIHPPYPVLVVAFILAGFGNGILDAAWNAWIGNLANSNEVLGFLHGFYGAGAVLSPAISTTMITHGGLQWWYFYYIMIGAAALELVVGALAFWNETGEKFIAASKRSSGGSAGSLREALGKRVTWITAIFLLVYVGIEVGLGGWIVTFMIRVREGGHFESGMTATGFWLGLTVGRFVLAFLTPRLGEKFSISLYLTLAVVMQLLFWLVPSFLLSAVTVAIVGFFIGPVFPTAIVATTKILPASLHVASIGFGAAFGSGGSCILPFAIGAIAQRAGVQALQPIILGFLAVEVVIWIFVMPTIPMQDGTMGEKVSAFAKKTAKRASNLNRSSRPRD